jgi:hypothetical protein
MQRIALAFILFAGLSPARDVDPAYHRVPARVGLLLIAAVSDGLALGADGSSLNADGRVSQEQKLFRLGKQGALALSGTVSLQDPIGVRERGEVNVARIAAAWVGAHPDADLETANRDLNAAVAAELNKFLATRDPGAAAGTFRFGVIAAGYSAGKPLLVTTKYFMPATKGKPARAEQTSVTLQPGDLWISGSSAVPGAVVAANATALRSFRDEPAAAKFRSGQKSTLTPQDYLGLFDVILRAAESDQGKKLDGKRAIAAPPNRFAMVTATGGFAWQPR